ncbi:lipopolysaccharide transport system ATP-binding protein [Chryseolinea serpens]|uniref:Lipopolysaccharide transport system ATP-binding protein n=1 Tax=Chryseolinea serpens TaxID=947013 RepID=A0A1M5KZ29_9BACT|nr:ABC transporter ATP-binding protein [Chryseolinea serpens]SHG57930.1 lipopolysaccharide transport system ATP-binding protein [Chryseolinea serpens]
MSTVIEVDNLGKLYRLGEISTGTLSHDLKRWWAKTRGKEDPYAKIGSVNDRTKRAVDNEYVWAVRNMSFQIRQGDIVGVIGKNGAGKSTLLKILSRITAPSVGEVKIKGRVASLLEVGTGFHAEMTGRENIYMNGTVLGMRRHEIDRKFDEIVDFAGVAKYVDTPVKRYSSGMMVRLGFAVAAFLEPEILIVDEVLAVGDAEFQKKAIGKMQEVSRGDGRTVLFVSHSMPSIKTLCKSCIILGQGQLEYQGDTTTAVEKYLNLNVDSISEFPAILDRETLRRNLDGVKDGTSPFLTLRQVSILNGEGKPTSSFTSKESISIKFDFDIHFVAPDFRIVISVVDNDNNAILNSQLTDSAVHENTIRPGSYSAICHFPKDFFATNTYMLTLHLINVKKEHYVYNGVVKFKVQYENPKYVYAPFDLTYFRPQLEWELMKKSDDEK